MIAMAQVSLSAATHSPPVPLDLGRATPAISRGNLPSTSPFSEIRLPYQPLSRFEYSDLPGSGLYR
jgi:hypothetical protein